MFRIIIPKRLPPLLGPRYDQFLKPLQGKYSLNTSIYAQGIFEILLTFTSATRKSPVHNSRKPSPQQEQSVFLKALVREQNKDSLLLSETLNLERGLKGSRQHVSMNHFINYSIAVHFWQYCASGIVILANVFSSEKPLFLTLSFVVKARETAQ